MLIRSGTQDIGTATRTLMAMITAETLGLNVDQIRVELGDSNHPFSGGSGGSTTAASVSPAIRVTSGMARDQLFERIAPALKTTADQLEIGVGRVAVRGTSTSLAWRDACKLLGTQPVSVDGQWERGLSASGTTGVQFADVEVDIETGITRVKKIVCVQDCGLIVDLKTAETQCYGGIISGVNYAVMEERIIDRNTANMVNPNMEFYLIAGQSDIPEIDVVLVDQPERGVIGIGEPPAVATAAADRQRRPQRHRRDDAQHSDHAGQAARRARARGRHELKAFAYVNPANEKEAVAALSTERGRFLPMAGGMDLLGLMKDYIVSPERVVNLKNLDATIAASDGGLRIGAAVKLADLAEHAAARRLFPALTTAAEDVGTPQIRNMGTVGGNIMQRPRCWYFRNEEFNCLKKGGSRCFAVEGENQYHAIFGDGPVPHRASVEPRRFR